MTQVLPETFGPFSISINDILGWGGSSLGTNTYSTGMRTRVRILGTHEDPSLNLRHPHKTKLGCVCIYNICAVQKKLETGGSVGLAGHWPFPGSVRNPVSKEHGEE